MTENNFMKRSFRYDINGLRAYAVALVVLFHFKVLGFSGGFIGVDIFFVISGFLMTKIIVSNFENESFNFLNFYISRANRIIPALAFLVLIVGITGWFTLLPQEFIEYAKHAISSLGFFSNIQYLREFGYFDSTAHEKLLLHTWSLSVEWQFYILLPILIWTIFKIFNSLKFLKIIYVLGFLFSLALSIYFSQKDVTAAFYLLSTRAWEMMSGGLIYLFFKNTSLSINNKKLLEIFGFGLIAISLLLFNNESSWPSYNAIIPVLGTFLILLSANNNSILTKNTIAQFLGNTSYSIYLWHWPIVFYLAYFEKSDNYIFIILAISLSVFLGWISYKYIENPTRKYLSNISILKAYLVTFSYVGFFICILLTIQLNNGFPIRLSDKTIKISNEEKNRNPRIYECHIASGVAIPQCKYGGDIIGAIVIGDSHAQSIIRSVEKSLPNKKLYVLDWTYASCPTIIHTKHTTSRLYQCDEVIKRFLEEKSKYKNVPIIITNRLNAYLEGDQLSKLEKPVIYSEVSFPQYNNFHKEMLTKNFVKTVCEITKTNPVFITTPIPEYYSNIPKTLAHQSMFSNNLELSIPLNIHQTRSKWSNKAINLAKNKCGAQILDVTPYFCDNQKCKATKDGQPFYYDDDHLSLYGADQLIPLFKTIFK